jgi:hypothetical protein
MKRHSIIVLACLALFGGGVVFGQAVPAPYTEASVWEITTIRVKPGMDDDYLKSLGQTLKKMYEEAKKQGVIVSYKVLTSEAATKDDWNVMLMVELKNHAAMDGMDAKFRAIEAKIVGNEDAQRTLSTKRLEIREILGAKIAQEIILK